MTTGRGQIADRETRSEVEEAERAQVGFELPEEPIPAPPPTVEPVDVPDIITQEDVTRAITPTEEEEAERAQVGFDLPVALAPEVTTSLTVGIDTETPFDITDETALSQLANIQDDEPDLFATLVREGSEAFNTELIEVNKRREEANQAAIKSQKVEEFVIQQEKKRFAKLNTELPDGRFISNIDFNRIRTESPEVFKALSEKGFDAANTLIQTLNQKAAGVAENLEATREIVSMIAGGQLPTDEETPGIIKSIWRILTPWNEEAGQTYLEYMKGFPERVKDTFLANISGGIVESQESLKSEFESNKDAPLWAQFFFPQTVAFDKKRDTYSRIVLAVSPDIRTKALPKLAFKEPVDWSKIANALKAGQIRSAQQAAAWARVNKAVAPAIRALEKTVKNTSRAGSKARRVSFSAQRHAIAVAKRNAAKTALVRANKLARREQLAIQTANRLAIVKQQAAIQNLFAASPVLVNINQSVANNISLSNRNKVTTFTIEQLRDLTKILGVEPVTQIQQQQQEIQQLLEQKAPKTQVQTQLKKQTRLLEKLQKSIKTETLEKTATALIISNAVATATEEETKTTTATELKERIKELIKQQIETITDPAEQTKIEEETEKIGEPLSVPEIELITEITTGIPGKPTEPEIGEPRKPGEPGKPGKPGEPGKPGKPPPKILLPKGRKIAFKEVSKAIRKGTIAWRQGQTRDGKGLWWVIKWPYASDRDAKLVIGRPKGAQVFKGKLSAFKTIQTLTGKAPQFIINLDLGVVDVFISKPTRKPGRKGAIRFKADPKQKTRGDIQLKGVRK